MKKTIKIEYVIEAEYDENSKEFQEALKSYREVIDPNADIDDFVKSAVYQVQRQGRYSLLEGIGYVKVNGYIEDESLYCGIEIEDDDPAADIDFY